MPRPANPIKQGKRLVYMDQHLFDHIDILFIDPLTGTPRKGAFSAYIENLVKRDLESRRRQAAALRQPT
jgi:hypothetical protein